MGPLAAEERDGKPTKVPYRADGAGRASSTDPATWATFEAASRGRGRLPATASATCSRPTIRSSASTSTRPAGSRPRRDHARARLAMRETSVGGNGVHVIVQATLNGHARNRRGPFEVYEHGRYFVVTGEHVVGTPTTIEERQAKLDEVLAHFLPKPRARAHASRPSRPSTSTTRSCSSARSRPQRRRRSATSAKAAGSAATRRSPRPTSRSARTLAFWTGRDPARIDRLFRSCGLMPRKVGARRLPRAARSKALGDRRPPATSTSSRPGRDAVGTRTASASAEKGEPRSRPRVPT